MFEYKDIEFYNNYCECLEDFTLLEAFTADDDNSYVGKIIPNNAIYPIYIYVHIPQTFPHNKLIFRTKSLSGYPHLIPYYETPHLGSWFCLNSAFAETAERQLDEEFNRLREWLKRQLRPELPQHISDKNTQIALRNFNIYEGNNSDEINEITEKPDFAFLGEFGKNPQNFKEKESGYLNAVKYPNQKFTILQNEKNSNFKLPYVIVDHLPKDIYSFYAYVNEFKWSDELCNTLLPDFQYGSNVRPTCKFVPSQKGASAREWLTINIEYECGLKEETAITHLKILRDKAKNIAIPEFHKDLLNEELDCFLKKNEERRKASKLPAFTEDDEYDYESQFFDYKYRYNYFAIGVVKNKSIEWFLVNTNRNGRKEETNKYDLELYNFEISRYVDIKLFNFVPAIHISEHNYFGRGKLHDNLSQKKIALIGLGAIGSALAETLVRGGLKKLTLWDGDLVESGNVCRSAYNITDIGNSKIKALACHLRRISPFCIVREIGYWLPSKYYTGICKYTNGEFYGNINYKSQAEFISALKDYDLIIDCTASNELLHFLSYAAKDLDVLSLCITNQSRDLLCISNFKGNLFEQRKHYLSCIEQESGNFYSEGTGCYAPTFLATSCDIQSLVNLCVRTMNREFQSKNHMGSMIWHYDDNNITCDELIVYQLENSSISMTISKNIIKTIRELPMLKSGTIGYLLGGYDSERTAIYVTNVISAINAQDKLGAINKKSEGIIGYLGSICVSSGGVEIMSEAIKENIVSMVQNNNVNTNNPILVAISPNSDINFTLYMRGNFVPFHLSN